MGANDEVTGEHIYHPGEVGVALEAVELSGSHAVAHLRLLSLWQLHLVGHCVCHLFSVEVSLGLCF